MKRARFLVCFFSFSFSTLWSHSPLFNSVCQKKSYQEAALQVNQSGPKCPGTVCYNSKGNGAYIMKPRSNRLINTSVFFGENDPILNSSGWDNILIYYLLKGWLLYEMHSYFFVLWWHRVVIQIGPPSQSLRRKLTKTSRYLIYAIILVPLFPTKGISFLPKEMPYAKNDVCCQHTGAYIS